ncbi:class IV lanthionine synthetase LanL [Amycolatopsis jiangsuensis]|uniref:non-specific serine/threonine protein kinase n=1 Tax=Amycolatopsis jiangsuensis TaxID=1181879 RepID=A0A840IQS3_9PSEU|nr:class IV lanthionine synthetase LanL [Amycolatopsis jiangsuensis]MBB4683737.1 hypothetical protein [Amycolatopsis jiangsuensis]
MPRPADFRELPSVFGAVWRLGGQPVPPADSPYVRVLRAQASGDALDVEFDEMWCHVRPDGASHPVQGWKIHVSATTEAAAEVLDRSAEVLLRNRCVFKFASSPDRLALLNSAHYPRQGAAKFITCYPRDDEHFRLLAEELHEAAEGLPGPLILSDRAYRPGSPVHYRYGGFSPRRMLTNDAELVGALVVPGSGTEPVLVPDRREAWFAPPPWARDPLADPAAPSAAPTGPAPRVEVLLGGRFAAAEAIRHSSRGGVYLATDRENSTGVIVKQARRHVTGNSGKTAQTALRHEAAVLGELEALGHTPAKLALFEQDGDLFLAEEEIEGAALRRWVREHSGVVGAQTRREPGVPLLAARAILRQLADVVESVHQAGWVLRDLSPGNVMVRPDGTVALVDLEFAAPAGSDAQPGGTPGYAAPEQLDGAPAAAAADWYSVGALGFLLVIGTDPVFPADSPEPRPARDRMSPWLAAANSAGAVALTPLIMGLVDPDPQHRWTGGEIRAFLAAETPAARPATPGHWPDSTARRVLADGLAHLCATFDQQNTKHGPWPRTCTTGFVDPANVQHGAAGVLAVLTTAFRQQPDQGLRDTVQTASHWLRDYVATESRRLPGLHFGRSGTGWAMHDAAGALGDRQLADAAVALAKQVPTDWENPDVAHGAAGAGIAQLRFWQATGDPEFRDRAQSCAEGLAARVVRTGDGIRWPIPAAFASRLAGLTHLGFAHGTAGIACFLLSAGLICDRDDWVSLAADAGRSLVAAAVGADATAALWPSSADDDSDPMEHWCSGSTGVATFLLRLWEATGIQEFFDFADRAATAAYRRRWHASPVQCHGLAGNGEFLLDLGDATGDLRYRQWAEELASTGYLRHALFEGKVLIPDETSVGFGTQYGVGMAGYLGFLLRLRYSLPRQWMVATPAPRRHRGGGAAPAELSSEFA